MQLTMSNQHFHQPSPSWHGHPSLTNPSAAMKSPSSYERRTDHGPGMGSSSTSFSHHSTVGQAEKTLPLAKISLGPDDLGLEHWGDRGCGCGVLSSLSDREKKIVPCCEGAEDQADNGEFTTEVLVGEPVDRAHLLGRVYRVKTGKKCEKRTFVSPTLATSNRNKMNGRGMLSEEITAMEVLYSPFHEPTRVSSQRSGALDSGEAPVLNLHSDLDPERDTVNPAPDRAFNGRVADVPLRRSLRRDPEARTVEPSKMNAMNRRVGTVSSTLTREHASQREGDTEALNPLQEHGMIADVASSRVQRRARDRVRDLNTVKGNPFDVNHRSTVFTNPIVDDLSRRDSNVDAPHTHRKAVKQRAYQRNLEELERQLGRDWNEKISTVHTALERGRAYQHGHSVGNGTRHPKHAWKQDVASVPVAGVTERSNLKRRNRTKNDGGKQSAPLVHSVANLAAPSASSGYTQYNIPQINGASNSVSFQEGRSKEGLGRIDKSMRSKYVWHAQSENKRTELQSLSPESSEPPMFPSKQGPPVHNEHVDWWQSQHQQEGQQGHWTRRPELLPYPTAMTE